MADLPFIYVTYIRTTPERLWAALTEPALTARYWYGTRVESTWERGEVVRLVGHDGEVTDTGTVLTARAPLYLSYSWTVSLSAGMREEGPSRASFELEPAGEAVKLTVTHQDFPENSKVRLAVAGGWPLILSSLKSFLETGSPLELTSVAMLASRQGSLLEAVGE